MEEDLRTIGFVIFAQAGEELVSVEDLVAAKTNNECIAILILIQTNAEYIAILVA